MSNKPTTCYINGTEYDRLIEKVFEFGSNTQDPVDGIEYRYILYRDDEATSQVAFSYRGYDKLESEITKPGKLYFRQFYGYGIEPSDEVWIQRGSQASKAKNVTCPDELFEEIWIAATRN